MSASLEVDGTQMQNAKKPLGRRERRALAEGATIPLPTSPLPPSTSTNHLMSPIPAHINSPNGSPSLTPNSMNSGRFDTVSPTFEANATPNLSDTSDETHGTQKRGLSVEAKGAAGQSRSRSPLGQRVASSVDEFPLPASPSDPTASILRHSPRTRPSAPPTIQSSPAPNSNGSPRMNAGLGVGPVGLSVPTSKADRRRSINPGLTFNVDAANGTFAAEPRLSPLPPSPLRASFSDAKNPGPQTPVSPSPSAGSNAAYPFPTLSSSQELAPPRTTSLGEGRAASPVTPPPQPPLPPIPQSSEPHERSPTGDRFANQTSLQPSHPPPIPPGNQDQPIPPNIPLAPPGMSFSLSDPDFAVILSNMIQSPERLMTGKIATKPFSSEDESDSGQSPAFSRSPLIGMLSNTIAASREPSADQLAEPVIIDKDRLSPMEAPGLRLRQLSAESTASLASRLGPESAFGALSDLLATTDDKQGSTSVSTSLLKSVVVEVTDLKASLRELQRKYTSTKRSSQQYSEGLTVAGEEYDKEVAMRHELEAEVIRLKAQLAQPNGQTQCDQL